MADPNGDLLQRLALLEAHMLTQEEILLAMHAERIEAERLNDSVLRLGDGASSLSEALLQVDKNAQLLTQLGRELENVAQRAATKDDMAAEKRRQAEEAVEFRRMALTRTYAIGLGLAVAGLVGAATFAEILDRRAETNISVCEQRNAQTELIVDVLRNDFGADGAAQRFEESLIDCRKEFKK